MSEAEQNETPQRTEDEWAELLAELTEVRKKRDQLDAQNLRVTDNLRRTIEERDKAVAQLESLRVEYLAAKEAANTNSDKAAALIEQLRDAALAQVATVTAERDVALADVRLQLASKNVIIAERDAAERERTESRAEVVQLRVERDAARKFADDTQVELSQWQVGHDAVKEQLARCKEATDMFEAENTALQDTVRQLRAKQVHGDLPGLLMSIQLSAEQARLLL